MTEKVKNELRTAKEERKAQMIEVEKFKDGFAKSLLENRDKILEEAKYPYTMSKKDIRREKRNRFFNKIKKALGL